jgi:hypothetical protein
LVEVWASEIVPLLAAHPGMLATTVLQHLQDRHPGRFGAGVLRTLHLAGPPGPKALPNPPLPGCHPLMMDRP